MSQSSSTLKKLSFELGGNAPFIVFEDADLQKAVAGAVASKFRSSGQTCVCANRIYVHKDIYSQFVLCTCRSSIKVQGRKWIRPRHYTWSSYSLCAHLTRLPRMSIDATSKGAECVIGGKPLTDLGTNFWAPTVLGNMTTDMQLAHEETFGPVAGIFPFGSEEEVITMANAEPVGLAGYFYSQDVNRCWRVAEALEVGMVGVNTGLISDAAVPFGGGQGKWLWPRRKQSGCRRILCLEICFRWWILTKNSLEYFHCICCFICNN